METRSTQETEGRYARHYLIEGWDQEKLSRARVLVVGAGALGNEVIKLLALLGIGNLLIVDFDTIEISNLTRSVLFREADIGKPKAKIAAERARELNPDVAARFLIADLEFQVGLGIYRAVDVVIGCLDSINARLALNRMCVRAGVPWLNGGIEAMLGEVSLYDGQGGACFECAMSPSMWEHRNQRFSCGGLRSHVRENIMPTTATVASMAASYLANEALLLLHTGQGKKKEGLRFSQKLYFTLKPYGFYIYDLPRAPDCLAHEAWEPVEVWLEKPSEITARALMDRSGADVESLELGFDLLTFMRCVECGRAEPIFQPLEQCDLTLTYCSHCQKETRRPDAISWLDRSSEQVDLPLSALGVPEHSLVALRASDETRRFIQLSGEDLFR